MRYFYLLQILCFNFVMAFAHNVTLTDSITNAPIFSATVCDADGNYLGRSDVNGNVKLEKGCAYYVSHICYESKKFIYDTETAPSIFDLKSFNRYSHDKFSLKNDFDWDVVTEKMFFVVEREYTDTMEFTPSDLMEQDYDRYSEIYPADEKTKNQLAKMEHVYHFTE